MEINVKWAVEILVKFSNGQIDVIRCKKIGQANVVRNECSEDAQGTTRFANSAKSSQNWEVHRKLKFNVRRSACEYTNSEKKEGS
jgi:hypothetical protein